MREKPDFPKTRDEFIRLVKDFCLLSGDAYREPNVVFVPREMAYELHRWARADGDERHAEPGPPFRYLFGAAVVHGAPRLVLAYAPGPDPADRATAAVALAEYYGVDDPEVVLQPF